MELRVEGLSKGLAERPSVWIYMVSALRDPLTQVEGDSCLILGIQPLLVTWRCRSRARRLCAACGVAGSLLAGSPARALASCMGERA
jgi:hypothetical protein